MPTNLWVTFPKPNPKANLRLFCLAHAGASARIFNCWSTKLPSAVEICPIELPGHGWRRTEIAFTQLQPLVETITIAITPYLDKPFACFGHSMGALLSFELATFLQKRNNQSPIHLLLSGRRAPEIPSPVPPIHYLPDAAFIERLLDYDSMPEQILQDTKFLELVLPTLRADFALVESYEYIPKPPLDCPITVFGGLQDQTVAYNSLQAWRKHTSAAFTINILPGNHSFIHSSQQLLLQSLSKIFQEYKPQN
jgi:medium-chain acyl-[acyl-carrier-protein] hydrolase